MSILFSEAIIEARTNAMADLHTAQMFLQEEYPLTSGLGMPIQAPFEFVGGLVKGMIGVNHLTEIQTCATDGEGVVASVETVVKDLLAKDYVKLISDVQTIVPELKKSLSDCESMTDEIKAIESWAQIFKDQTTLTSTVAKNLLLHPIEIKRDVAAVKADWASSLFFKAGMDAADLVAVAIGPIVVPSEIDLFIEAFSIAGIPKLLEGFLATFVKDSDLPELETCYTSTSPLLTYINQFISDLTHFKLIKAIETAEEFVFHMQLDLLPCMHMTDDIQAIEQWAQIFKNPTELMANVTKHYLLHQRRIKADIADFKASEAAGNYYQAGADLADILAYTVGPIQQPTEEALY